MSCQFSFAKTACLLNEDADCNPIWLSQPEGLRLVHFQTLREGAKRGKNVPVVPSYESCERGCLHSGRSSKHA
jgi:hypothetical protein